MDGGDIIMKLLMLLYDYIIDILWMYESLWKKKIVTPTQSCSS
mgnify:CR=1 FL=1